MFASSVLNHSLNRSQLDLLIRKGVNAYLFMAPPLLPSSAVSGAAGVAGLGVDPALPEPAAPPLLISTIVPEIATPVGPIVIKFPAAIRLSSIPA